VRWAHVREMRNAYTIFDGKHEGKGLSEELSTDCKRGKNGRTILRWIV